MSTKTLIAGLVTALVGFFLGWLVFGIAMDSFYKANTAVPEGMMRTTPHFLGLIVMNLAFGMLVAWVLSGMGVKSLAAGFLPGAILGFLYALSFDMFFWSFMNFYMNKTVVIVDLLVNAVFVGILGAVAGWVLGMGAKPATA
jgi:hypothetical protein